MAKTINQLQRKIMRRVYYVFGLRIATHTITIHMLIILFASYVLTRLVHVAAVLENVANTRVGDFAVHMLRIFQHADVATLLVLGIVLFAVLSLKISLRTPQFRKMQIV